MSKYRNQMLQRLAEARSAHDHGAAELLALARDCIEYTTDIEDLLRDIANSGVELEDERLRYVTVQIDRPTWEALRRWRDAGA